MTFRVVIEEQATLDLEQYVQWIMEQGSPLDALRWLEDIEHAICSLSSFPERCPIAAEAESLGFPIRQLLFKSHRVLFTVVGSSVHVLHVRHGARLPLDPET